jgi:hypothetical protein
MKKGLYEYDGTKLNLLFSYPENNSLEILGIFSDKEGVKIITRNKGIYNYNNGKLRQLSLNVSNEIIKIKSSVLPILMVNIWFLVLF